MYTSSTMSFFEESEENDDEHFKCQMEACLGLRDSKRNLMEHFGNKMIDIT